MGKFLEEFGPDFTGSKTGYLTILYKYYSDAVKGIVKTDLPTVDEILGYLWSLAYFGGVPASPDTDPAQLPWQPWFGVKHRGPRDPSIAFSGDGYEWSGIYGAAATYPQYGYYGQAAISASTWPPPTNEGVQSLFTSSYVVSGDTTSTLTVVSEWQRAQILYEKGSDTYVAMAAPQGWVIPWLENKLIFGRMARWKAIYLLNRYDLIWSFLQKSEFLFQPPSPIVQAVNLPDGTAADGNWSARELIASVKVSELLLAGNVMDPSVPFIWQPATVDAPAISGYSVAALAQVFYNVANGNWGGPPLYLEGEGPPLLSLRELIAAVAL
jgi:hypothetical protein